MLVIYRHTQAVYGHGIPGKTVTVEIKDTGGENGGDEEGNTVVGADGLWRLVLKPRAASNPASTGVAITASAAAGDGGWNATITDVLFGELPSCLVGVVSTFIRRFP
jgi:hypothetical protein